MSECCVEGMCDAIDGTSSFDFGRGHLPKGKSLLLLLLRLFLLLLLLDSSPLVVPVFRFGHIGKKCKKKLPRLKIATSTVLSALSSLSLSPPCLCLCLGGSFLSRFLTSWVGSIHHSHISPGGLFQLVFFFSWHGFFSSTGFFLILFSISCAASGLDANKNDDGYIINGTTELADFSSSFSIRHNSNINDDKNNNNKRFFTCLSFSPIYPSTRSITTDQQNECLIIRLSLSNIKFTEPW